MSNKSIIFFPLHYPFHFSDSYLDAEFDLLAKNFKKAVIITTNTFSEEQRPIPTNAVLYRFTPHSPKNSARHYLRALLAWPVYQEIFNLIFKYKIGLSVKLIKEVFAFYMRALHTKDFLQQVIKDEKIDTANVLIYTYWMIESSLAVALLKSEIPTIQFISRAHSLDVYFERSTVGYNPFRKLIFKCVNRLYFISANARDYFARTHFFSATAMAKTQIARIGFAAENSVRVNTPGKILRVISVGYIQKLKRVDLIVDALSLITDIQVEWVHVGSSNHDLQDFEKIKDYARTKLRGKQNISYRFMGTASKPELFALYEKGEFDVFLNVSETEGIPVSMMEAMSYSVPVIGTNVGGVSEIVMDGVNGFLLTSYPGAEEVEQALVRFFNLDDVAKIELRKNAFDTWNAHYNAQINNEKFVADVISLIK